jgi:hypothetical protein
MSQADLHQHRQIIIFMEKPFKRVDGVGHCARSCQSDRELAGCYVRQCLAWRQRAALFNPAFNMAAVPGRMQHRLSCCSED